MWLLLVFGVVVVGCGAGDVVDDKAGDSSESVDSSGSSEAESEVDGSDGAEVSDEGESREEFVGELVELGDDGSVVLPFDGVVVDAVFSGDGRVKLLRLVDELVVVDGAEIVYVDSGSSLYFPAVSEDGRFAAWVSDDEDMTVGVYDVSRRQVDMVESSDEVVVFSRDSSAVIERLNGRYYYMDNSRLYGLLPLSATDVERGEIYAELDEAGMELLQKLAPEEAILDLERYDLYDEAVRDTLDPISEKWDVVYEDDGYYHLFYHMEEDEVDESVRYVTSLYGYNLHDDRDELVEISTDSFGLGEAEWRIVASDMRVDDASGVAVVPMFKESSEGSYVFGVYVVDLSVDEPQLSRVTEMEVAGEVADRPRVMFNEAGDGVYVAMSDGTMTLYKWK